MNEPPDPLPLAQLPDGRLFYADSRWPTWLVVLIDAAFLLLCLGIIYALAWSLG